MATQGKLRILVILSRIPFPLEKGDKLRAYHQLRFLSRKHEVHLIALSDVKISPTAIQELKSFLASVHIFRLRRLHIYYNILLAWIKGLPLQVGYFYNSRISKQIKMLATELQPDHLYCQLIRTTEYGKGIPIAKTLDYQDVFSVGTLRQAEKAKWWMKPVLLLESKRLVRYENAIFDWFNNHTIISVPDRDLIPHPRREEISVVLNGVDNHYFSPQPQHKDIDIIFTGNMGYPPNVDACRFLIQQIMPLVWKELPKARVMLAGASPHPEVRDLACERVMVTGWVDDIRSCYARSQVFIAPMRIGTGLQNKLLEAMAMGLPCITTPLAFSALHPDALNHIRIGHDADSLANNIIRLLRHKDLSESLGLQGRSYVIQHYNWETATRVLESLMLSSASFKP